MIEFHSEYFIFWFNGYTPWPDYHCDSDDFIDFTGYEYLNCLADHGIENPIQCPGPIIPPLHGPMEP